jgi:hypothetical protein
MALIGYVEYQIDEPIEHPPNVRDNDGTCRNSVPAIGVFNSNGMGDTWMK